MHDAEGVEVVDAADELVHEPLDLHGREVVLPVGHLFLFLVVSQPRATSIDPYPHNTEHTNGRTFQRDLSMCSNMR